MVFFNWATMQMAAKIVYYGPGLCGKTTNLSYIYAKTSPSSRGEMVSLETESDRTLFFDLLPIEVGTIGGFKTRLQLYTVPGQVFYNTTRKLVLKGVDGVVFVADSQRPMREANQESLANLRTNLKELGLDFDTIPLVLQYNKRDLKNILTIEELQEDLNPDGAHPYFEASAINGSGVFETLKEITKLTLKQLRDRLSTPEKKKPAMAARPRTGAKPVTPATPPPVTAASLAHAVADAVDAPPQARAAATVTAPETRAPARLHAVPEAARKGDVAQESEAPLPQAVEADETPAAEEEPSGVAPAAEAAPRVVEQPAGPTENEPVAAPEEPAPVSGEQGTAAETEGAAVAAAAAPAAPPPIKRVKVSNQMDILAELDNLRRQATMKSGTESLRTPSVDLDTLIAGELERSRTIRRKLAEKVNGEVFKKLGNVEIAIRLTGRDGETITTLDVVKLPVERASTLEELAVILNLKLENSS